LTLGKNVFNKIWSPKLIFANEIFLENSIDFLTSKNNFESTIWHFLLNCHSSTEFLLIFSFEYVDSWPRILLFRTHYLSNFTTKLILLCICQMFNRRLQEAFCPIVKKIAGIVQFSLSHCIYFPGLFIKKKKSPSERNKKNQCGKLIQSKRKKETKRKKRKKEKLFYVFTTMTSLSAVDNLECNNAGNKSVQNCKKKPENITLFISLCTHDYYSRINF
jgi:hypothetical protein